MKHWICRICILSVLLQMIAIPHICAADKSYPFLTDTGVISEESNMSDTLDKSEFARMLIFFSSGGNCNVKMDFMSAAKKAGYLQGNESDFVSVNDVAEAVMRVIGIALPDGEDYFKAATGRGLFKGINILNTNKLTVGEIAEILYNALELKVFGLNGESTGMTALEAMFDAYTEDGVLYPADSYGGARGRILIGEKIYDCDNDYDEAIGKKVRAYVSKNKVISIDDEYFKNQMYVISANDILEIDGYKISFVDSSGKTEECHLSKDVTEVYNGRICDFISEDFNISNGFVTLIRHGGGSEYDVAVIRQYDVMVAGNVGNGTIYDNNNHGLSVCVNDGKTDVDIVYDGDRIDASDIQKNDVLMVYYTKDREKLRIEVIRSSVSGQLTSKNTDTVTVGRRTYVKSAYFKTYADSFTLGDTVKLILDSSGLAIDFVKISQENCYGYFMGITDIGKGFYRTVRILDSDGNIELFRLDDSLTVDGIKDVRSTSGTSRLEVSLKTLVQCDTSGVKTQRLVNDYVYQVIRYSTDKNGYIDYIDTASELPGENDTVELKLDAAVDSNKRFKSGSYQFVDSFGMSETASTVFYVPQSDNIFDEAGNLDSEQRMSASDEDYKIIKPGFIKNDSDDITAYAYNLSAGGLAEAVTVLNKNVGKDIEFSSDSAPLFMLCELTLGTDGYGEDCYLLKGSLEGNYTVYYLPKNKFGREEGKSGETQFVEPQPGDILQINADSDNRVASYSTRYSGRKNINYYSYIGNNIWSQFSNFSAYVYDLDDYGMCTVSDLTTLEDKRFVMNKSVKKVYVYDLFDNTVRTGSLSELVSYKNSAYKASKIFARGEYGVINTIVIFVGEERR